MTLTPKQYAAKVGCTPQNITKKIRTYSGIEDAKRQKRYLLKSLPGVKKIKHFNRFVLIEV